CLVDDLVFYGLHRLLGQVPSAPVVVTIAYSLIGTTIAGTFIYLILRALSTDKIRRQKRDFFAPRRQTRRRNPIRLGRR
ncbi:MAG TPA: hypothetical protein PKM58_06530, partial [Pyrinomonadaceae bacterium]|nr:hypothetical protein [Pyrinomonadaceae bacterium]